MAASDSDDEVPSMDESEGLLFHVHVVMTFRSKLTADDTCIIVYWSVMAGALRVELDRLAKEPIEPYTGHSSENVSRVAGVNLQDASMAVV